MKVYETWEGMRNQYANLMVGLGNFDGVHLGHRQLICKMVTAARERKATPAVFTFHPHPLAVLDPEHAPPLLLTPHAKEKIMCRLGVEVLLRVPFTAEFARIGPREFIEEVLFRGLGVKTVFVGYNYTFGYRGEGTPELLKEYSRKYGFEVHVVPPVTVDGQVVSSTLIRSLLLAGEVTKAARFMGYYPFVEGQVVTGDRRGSTLGFPTANLNPEEGLLIPANGVYSVEVEVDGDRFLGVANIGTKPTFNAKNVRPNIEVHLLDFQGDLYGRWILVRFRRRLREERRFASVAELVAQIQKDIHQARMEYGGEQRSYKYK
ncbi:bifunctional riboflavin kinase/FAD synthetase [Desulfofundulus thermosubterraneus]|uniref:Riboflavin biosynthesis protein n=1 Tax=Desulfofundulus thermosubterraneus DSM 16057 TaxID=1121432 RepID=A0A1M6B508_9FIRM|nr:bifunctional riboflavin kinase/FAD synthetase [Desulfofundulus thermosubterraneus]SHI43869.1 riboflavin kinase / FMN adenylyltransferase [Desulfofundulus thermosubterraneus DSM 16057]